MQYRPKQVIGMLKTYKDDKDTLEKLTAEFDNNNTCGEGVAQYGTDAAMPRGNNISDPTFQRARDLLTSNNVIRNLENRVEFIESNQHKLIKDKHVIVFVLRIQGHTCDYIGQTLLVSRTQVHNYINEIAQIFCKTDEEYEEYKRKQLAKQQ
ncbi:hypothetical protein [Staphylococcus hyicus]|uniref:hypothetical protein n=1 Tax=Staphylococcus hyicus TaxID=1284 RepID=UPI00211C97B0|nr:hypothetical protein [Staphylococcus hyicus]MCQ9290684.1 hypothetical protein [Staphylococcus hyicus]MCQ9305926.1 hypothetical protein [Staphylococcus hyicus]MCQ9308338.1 hypothetical protein [Staphylococcus hyicus]MCQ9310760.1 hypothetical protein [Staphylococcus hyicus]